MSVIDNMRSFLSKSCVVPRLGISSLQILPKNIYLLPHNTFASKKNIKNKIDRVLSTTKKSTQQISHGKRTPTKQTLANAKKSSNQSSNVPRGSSPPVSKAHLATSHKIANILHPRTHWYMCRVKGITENPTALGFTPPEYMPQRVFVESMDSPVPEGATILKVIRTKDSIEDHNEHCPTDYYYYELPTVREECPFDRLSVHSAEVNAFQKSKFVLSAYSVGQTPPIRSHTRDVEIMFAGRSNVGKSSLLNTLTQTKLAQSSQKPGKTQSLNFYCLGPNILDTHKQECNALAYATRIDPLEHNRFLDNLKWNLDEPLSVAQTKALTECVVEHANGPMFFLVDVPGYGFAKAPKPVVDHWNALIGGYVRLRSPTRYPLLKEYSEKYLNLIKDKVRTSKKKNRVISNESHGITMEIDEEELAAIESGQSLAQTLEEVGLTIEDITIEDLENIGVPNPEKMLNELRHQQRKLAELKEKEKQLTESMEREREMEKETVHITKQPTKKNQNDVPVLPPYALYQAEHGSPLKTVVILIEPKLGIQKQDLNFMDFLEAFKIPYQVVITKSDRVNRMELEGAALSIAQTLFPHAYLQLYTNKTVEEVTKEIKKPAISLERLLKKEIRQSEEDGETYTPEQFKLSPTHEALWLLASKSSPRQHCSPLLLSVSSQSKEGISTLKKAILNAAFTHL